MNALILTILASTTAADRVVVFPDRAQVTRVTQVQCGARVPVTFDHIPPVAAQDSFRARVFGGSIDGMRAELVTQDKEFSPKADDPGARCFSVTLAPLVPGFAGDDWRTR